jgi:hypothetical protein
MLVFRCEDLGKRCHGPSLGAFVPGLALDLQVLFGMVRPACELPACPTELISGRLYMAGRMRNQNLAQKYFYRDIFCLDLEKLDEWRKLSPYPIPESRSGLFLGWTMVVHNSKAYLFTGRPQLNFFDLVTKKWGSVMTKLNVMIISFS